MSWICAYLSTAFIAAQASMKFGYTTLDMSKGTLPALATSELATPSSFGATTTWNTNLG